MHSGSIGLTFTYEMKNAVRHIRVRVHGNDKSSPTQINIEAKKVRVVKSSLNDDIRSRCGQTAALRIK